MSATPDRSRPAPRRHCAARVSLDGHRGSMTSWRYLFLCVFLSTVDLSKEGCKEYFRMEEWKENLTDTVSLLITKNTKDTMLCTLENECRKRKVFCNLLYHCFTRTQRVETLNGNCRGGVRHNVSYYHFMCLVAKASNQTAKTIHHIGCDYDTPCKVYSEKAITALDQTTLPPTTTTTTTTTTLPPTTTTTTTTTTTLPPTTILPERTTAAPTATTAEMPPKATTLPPQPAVTQSSLSHGQNSQPPERLTAETSTLKTLLFTSLILHVAVPLAVYLYMRRQMMQDRTQQRSSVTYVHVNSPGLQPVTEPNALLPPAIGGEIETSHLMQPPRCHCVVTHSADLGRNECSVWDGRLDEGANSRLL